MAKRMTLKNYSRESQLFRNRMITSSLFILTLVLLLIVRLGYLQLYQHQRYTTLSNKNQLALIPIEPNRGLIYDRNGILLAENVPSFSLDIIPNRVKNFNQTIKELQQLFDIDEDMVKLFHQQRHQHRPFEPIPIKLKLSTEEVARFSVHQHQFPGVVVNARMIRHYPLGADVVNVLGYVGRINERELAEIDETNYSATNFIGKLGIERAYENQLHGEVGYRQVEVNATGQIVRTLKRYPPISGDDLMLSIDSHLQHVAHDVLKQERGAVVAIDPSNGEVLALVSHPSYDPNPFVTGISHNKFNELQSSEDKPLYNRAIRGRYPIASTIKPFFAIKGLDCGVITPRYAINDPGQFQLPGNDHIYRDWKRSGHGLVNLRTALIVSCDTYFYQLAVNLGIDKLNQIMHQFGFGQLTGLELHEEVSGLLPTPEWKLRTQHAHWFTGDTINSGIGQGFMLATPLQLANSTATLATRGLRYRPHLLLQSQHPDGSTTDHSAQLVNNIELSDTSYWETVIKDMQGVITSYNPKGTGWRFGRTPPYSVAAKTGTAQFYRPKQYENLKDADIPKKYRDHSLFIAFAPVEHPKIAVAVVVENSPIAPKIARQVIDAYLKPAPQHQEPNHDT